MTTILTLDKLKEITAISDALGNQVDLLLPFVEIAETIHLQDVLGIALYEEIIDDVENGTLSGFNETLVENYLYNLSAWYSYFEASPFLIYRAEAKGITKKYSENSQALDRGEFALFRQSILDKAMYFRNTTINFLNKNLDNYPLYRCDERGGQDFASGIYV